MIIDVLIVINWLTPSILSPSSLGVWLAVPFAFCVGGVSVVPMYGGSAVLVASYLGIVAYVAMWVSYSSLSSESPGCEDVPYSSGSCSMARVYSSGSCSYSSHTS